MSCFSARIAKGASDFPEEIGARNSTRTCDATYVFFTTDFATSIPRFSPQPEVFAVGLPRSLLSRSISSSLDREAPSSNRGIITNSAAFVGHDVVTAVLLTAISVRRTGRPRRLISRPLRTLFLARPPSLVPDVSLGPLTPLVALVETYDLRYLMGRAQSSELGTI